MKKKTLLFLLVFCAIVSGLFSTFATETQFPLISNDNQYVADENTKYIITFEQDPTTKLITATTQINNEGKKSITIGLVSTQIKFSNKVAPCKYDGTDLYFGELKKETSDIYKEYYMSTFDVISPFVMQNNLENRLVFLSAGSSSFNGDLVIKPGETKDISRCYFMPINNIDLLDDNMFEYSEFVQLRTIRVSPFFGTGCEYVVAHLKRADIDVDNYVINPDSFKMHFKKLSPTNLSADILNRNIINYDENTMEWSESINGPYKSGKPSINSATTSIYVRLKGDQNYSKTTDIFVNYIKYISSDAVKIDFTK